jgi:hypothetical protein
MLAIFRLNYARNTINTEQAFPWITILFLFLSKEYFSYDAEKIIILAILLIIIFGIFFFKEIINDNLEIKYYNTEYFWYELFLNKSAVIWDYWRLLYVFVDQEDVNQSILVVYNERLNLFFERNKKKYFLFLFFLIKSRFLKDIIEYINIIYKILLNYIESFFYIKKHIS